jgi:hypothetical protein
MNSARGKKEVCSSKSARSFLPTSSTTKPRIKMPDIPIINPEIKVNALKIETR